MGRIRLSQSCLPRRVQLEQIREACPTKVERADCYRYFRTLGLEYGPSFQGITQLWQGERQALARVDAPAEIVADMDAFNLHPAVLDVCLQSLAAALPIDRQSTVVFMPVGVETLRIHHPLPQCLWLHASINHIDEQILNGDLIAYDEEGRCILEMRQCRARALGGDGIGFTGAPQKLFQPDWVELAHSVERVEPQVGVWLVYGGDLELRQRTLEALVERNSQAQVVMDQQDTTASPQAWAVAAEDSADWQRILEQAGQLAGGQAVRGVIHLGLSNVALSSEAQEYAGYGQALHQGCLVMVALTRALASFDATDRPRLWVVTRGTQPVAGHPVINPMQAAVWGMGRVLGHAEHIDIWGGLIDLPEQSVACEADWIAQDCILRDGEDEIAWRDGRRHVMRLHECPSVVSLPTAPAFRSNATYLITGGLGALGLVVARWMVRHGVRHLLLLGRDGLPPRDQWLEPGLSKTQQRRITEVLAIEAAGCHVRVEAVDITDRAALEGLLVRHARSCYPPIRGVIHAAGLTHPMLMAQLTAVELETTLSVKLKGAWNLHQTLAGEPLDFFTLFSSVASLVVSMGQSAYAAANAALDSLAHYRHGLGLPATSINWGPWGDVGMASELNLLDFFNGRGLLAMSSAQGCQMLGELMSGRCSQAAVLGVRWKTVADTSPLGIPAPAIEHVLRDEVSENYISASADTNEISFAERYRNCVDDEGRLSLVLAELRDHVCKVMRIDDATLHDKTPLSSYGMDSMMAIELKNRVERLMAVKVAIVDILKGATIEGLARLLEPELQVHLVSEDATLLDIVDAMQGLSDEEISVLMGDEAGEEEAQ